MSDNAPNHLSKDAKLIWRGLLRRYHFNEAESLVLQLTLEASDRKAQVRLIIDKEGLIASGKPHPLLVVERDCGQTIMRGVRLLKLEESEPLVKDILRRVG